MNKKNFKALEITENDGNYERKIIDKEIDDLPEGDLLIKVKYSSLNYKDALSAIGTRGVTNEFPHTPGIDAAGTVVEDKSNTFKDGDKVIVTGYDLGMDTDGGFEEYIRIPADWAVKLPDTLSLKESMIYGTAGFTAALSVYKLLESEIPGKNVLVTGASGGVGSFACSILAESGYNVTAVTGKTDEKEYFEKIGVKEIIDRHEFSDESGKMMLKAKWDGVIDIVGGNLLATAIKSTKYDGSITCCGNVASGDLPINVYPFILRGVSLFGIDSVQCKRELREKVWEKLSGEWKIEQLNEMYEEISLEDLNSYIDKILEGELKGRTIVKI